MRPVYPSFLQQVRRQYSSSVQIATKLQIPEDAVIYSLIQPTGDFHVGNYLGAITNWKDISRQAPKSAKIIYGVADLHALTIPKDPKHFKQLRRQAIASIIASGIDTDRCTVYYQSSIPEHSELNWILNNLCGMGYLNRMTQWKSKGKLAESQSLSTANDEALSKISAGLFNYPVLQAADILIYKSTHVPVGDDQSQHLELCRHLAGQFNKQVNTNYFKLPVTLFTPSKKILSLKNPSKKMSKSDPDVNGSIYIRDSPEAIRRKIAKATTDSIQGELYFDPITRPGVSNLINIISGVSGKSIDDTLQDLKFIKNHKQLKDHVSDILIEEFSKPRLLFEKLIGDETYLDEISNKGRIAAGEIAAKNIQEIKQLVGLD